MARSTGAKPGAVLVESSTVTPAWISELALLAAERKLHLLDAPVTGSRPQAEGGQLTFLVGGDARRLGARSASAFGHEQRRSCCLARSAAARG